MQTFTRRNAWNNNGTFSNTDLLWYAKGVKEMQTRSLDDETSWWFFAAMHGQYITNDVNSGDPPEPDYDWANISGPPNVPTAPLPAPNVQKKYWDQCQHGTWFFPPWHRGYLYAIENILRTIVNSLGGPEDWALPYWNYFGPGNQYMIPPAFTQKLMPDQSPNPLFVNARYGPTNNGNIFVPLAGGFINENCQQNTDYVGVEPNYYGGDTSGFAHSYNLPGSLEMNPHNFVHGAIGGQNPSFGIGGLMSIPNTAALDPIFYLHHCNIDRLWATWNAAANSNPTNPNWLNGPTATGNRKFHMPKPDKTNWPFTPAIVDDISKLDYTYDTFASVPTPVFAGRNARLLNFGFSNQTINSFRDMADFSSEVIGANQAPISLDASGARTTVKLDAQGWNTVSQSITKAFAVRSKDTPTESDLPDEVYLQLEGIKGKDDSIVCSVSVNHQYAGHVSLFGLRNASAKGSHGGGAGLTVRLNISKIVDALHISSAIGIDSLDVLIQPVNIVAKGNELTIDRVSVFRRGQK